MLNRRVGKEAWAKRLLIGFGVLGFALLARTAAAGTITVAWDLMLGANVTGYRVYVGTAPGRYTETFDVPADRYFYIFRSAFMGVRYYFSVAAQFDNSTYGPRSQEVTAVGTRTVAGGLPDGARVGGPVPAADCGADCFVVTALARGLGEISSMAVSPGGTVFAVEGNRRVVALQSGAAVTIHTAEPGTTLHDVALDPQFDVTGRVFVSTLRPRDGASADVELVRLRYFAGTLGEPSALATGVSVPLSSAVPFAVGGDGLLYLAVPSAAARGPYSASVLAFDQDGRVPAGQRSASPVVASGLDTPVDLTWDSQADVLWLAGQNEGASSQLLAVSRVGTTLSAPGVLGDADTVTSLAVAPGGGRRLLVGAGVDIIEAVPGATDIQRIPLDDHGPVVAVASARAGERVVAVRIDAPSGPTHSILQVADGRAVLTR
jgi:hypothetical protein